MLQATESGGKFNGKGKFGKKDKGKGKNVQLDQGAQVTEWKPENWKWNNWSEKAQQKGYGRKGKGEKKGKEWRAPSPQRQPAFASSQFDNKSTAPSLDSLRVREEEKVSFCPKYGKFLFSLVLWNGDPSNS